MDGIQLPQGLSHFEEAVYFLPLTFVIIFLISSMEKTSLSGVFITNF